MNSMLVRAYHPEHDIFYGLVLGGQVHVVEDYGILRAVFKNNTPGQLPSALAELEARARQATAVYPFELFDRAGPSGVPHLLAPIDNQEVWAAGVTYERSRAARQEEALDGGDIYARVYAAERPELFFKAHGPNVVGPHGLVGIRADAIWSVPEPELAVVLNPALDVVGFTVGNDMSSRDIEGANPLYLPQAKVYTASCALGPCILLQPSDIWPETTIQLAIQRAGRAIFSGEVETSRIKRKLRELVDYLGRSTSFPNGVVLLTGTGIVPPGDFTLAEGDVVRITIDGIGTLVNTVKVV